MGTKYHIQQANSASTGSFEVVVPTPGELLQVWTELSQGRPPSHGIEGFAKAKDKVVKSRAVIAEALRALDRMFKKKKKTTISLLRDESKARLQISFGAVCKKTVERRHTTSANDIWLDFQRNCLYKKLQAEPVFVFSH